MEKAKKFASADFANVNLKAMYQSSKVMKKFIMAILILNGAIIGTALIAALIKYLSALIKLKRGRSAAAANVRSLRDSELFGK